MLIKVETSNFHLPGSRDPTKWNGPFTFALLADPQVGPSFIEFSLFL